jgi:hypothetical protein
MRRCSTVRTVEIRDGELVLRTPSVLDLEAVVAACRDPEIPRFIPFVPVPYDRTHAEAWLQAVARGWNKFDERTSPLSIRLTAAGSSAS